MNINKRIKNDQYQMTQYIYVLKLTEGKFYVGRSKNVWQRLVWHSLRVASTFTRKYRLMQVIDIYESVNPIDEDNKTKEMMLLHGIKNVRGGSYNRIEYMLNKEFCTLQKRCYNCGQKGHFILNCPEKRKAQPKMPKTTQAEQIDRTEGDGEEALLGHRRESPIEISDDQDELLYDRLYKKRKEESPT